MKAAGRLTESTPPKCSKYLIFWRRIPEHSTVAAWSLRCANLSGPNEFWIWNFHPKHWAAVLLQIAKGMLQEVVEVNRRVKSQPLPRELIHLRVVCFL